MPPGNPSLPRVSRSQSATELAFRVASAAGLTPYGFSGRYASWSEAAAQAGGYDAPAILAAVESAARDVHEGRAAFERDGLAFASPDAAWPELACLLRAAAKDGHLRVVDVGGALGGFHRQHARWFDGLAVRWAVVEQPHYVEAGRRAWEDATQTFHATVEEAARAIEPNVILLSSVLQYLPDAEAMIRSCLATKAAWVVVSRTPVADVPGEGWITLQTVRRGARASYPMRVFDEARLLGAFERCSLLARLPSHGFDRGGFGFGFRGYLLGRHGAS